MAKTTIRRGGIVDRNTGMGRIICGAIISFVAGCYLLMAVETLRRGYGRGSVVEELAGPGLALLGGLGLLYWGLHARFKWHVAKQIVLSSAGLWHRDSSPELVPWTDVRAVYPFDSGDPALRLGTATGERTIPLVGLDRDPVRVVLTAMDLHRRAHGQPSMRQVARRTACPCPVCKRPSKHVKCYRMMNMLFLFIAAGGQGRDEVGCPACIRIQTLAMMGINLITANVVWPFVFLPYGLFLLGRSVVPGHSRKILGVIEEELAQQTAR